MKKLFAPILVSLLSLAAAAPAAVLAQPPAGAGDDVKKKEAPAPDPKPANWTTSHSLQLGGGTVEYDAVVGSVILRDDKEKATGELFYTAYFRTGRAAGDANARPLIFSYNGGPGSASYWLHMGIMGPRRVRTPEVGQQAPPPYEIVDNRHTLLDVADIVMVDPIGTGFSRSVGETEGKVFWGLDEDAASLTQFIRRFLSQYKRWNSPRYLLGESYGTTRSAVLAGHLQRSNIDLNGIVLVSAVLDFETIGFREGSVVPFIVNLPSYAITSAYLDALPGGKPKDLQAFMAEVERWSVTEYATAVLAGSAVDPALRARVLDQMHAYTGLDKDFLDKTHLRVSAPEYEKELLRDKGLVVGRLDARFTGPTGDLLDRTPSHDPQSTAISSAYTSAFNAYVRGELGYDGDREYVPSGMARPWNWERQSGGSGGFFGRGAPNVAPDLARALTRNPKLEVLLVNGLYDLATPYFAAVWSLDNLNLPPDLRDNIERADFAAGHMMYVEESLLDQWRETLVSFLERTSGRAGGNAGPATAASGR
ncbi:MAG TPA: peptidase S10 [Thermoanaerobaculia bacterium]|nr:peptidase S10 [Thermoanaerobaculia bacterium]